MFFIGIITNQKNEEYMLSNLSKKFSDENIIFITDNNISNIKNIKFDTILIDDKINDEQNLKKIIKNARYVILNSDFQIDKKIFENLHLNIITYGFNNKCTFSVSSVSDCNVIVCLQRSIWDANNRQCEPQEFEVKVCEGSEIGRAHV